MRLKTFTAPTMHQAMRLVRDELGPDAVIVSTLQRTKNGAEVRVTAAIEHPEAATETARPPPGRTGQGPRQSDAAAPTRLVEQIRCALEDHGTPEPIVARLANAVRVIGGASAELALAAALDECFRFAPLADKPERKPIMLVGPPGSGKTVTAAKIAARAALARRGATLITTDTARPGAIEQLEGFARLLEAPLRVAKDADELAEAVGECRLGDAVVIDTAGANPFRDDDMQELAGLIAAGRAEPVLVLAAGGDARESAEIAEAFAVLGTARLLVTRLDLARRLGSLLAAADGARLRFSNVGAAPGAASGLAPLNPVSLARLLLPGSAARLPQEESAA